jgi:NAD(P)H-dependent FMN reductase
VGRATRILLISGSLRAGSTNAALLATAADPRASIAAADATTD